jgi:hypothetical protein
MLRKNASAPPGEDRCCDAPALPHREREKQHLYRDKHEQEPIKNSDIIHTGKH